MDETTPGISYIVPAHNEEETIVSTVARIHNALSDLDLEFEIIVVDDGSTDQTHERLKSCPNALLIHHPVNTGYGSAIKTGILHAQYAWIGIVDADGTYCIEELPRLVEKMQDGFDMAIASRTNVFLLDRPIKRLFRRMLIRFLNFVISGRIVDPNSGFRIFTKDLAMTFFPFLCNTFSFTTSITIFALGEGFFVGYVPMNYERRVGRTKVRHIRDSLRMAQLILQGVTFFNPVKFYLMLVVALVILVGIPAAVLTYFGFGTFAVHYGLIGSVSALLVGLGVLGDIVRISMTNQITKEDAKFRWKIRNRARSRDGSVERMRIAK